MNDKEASDEPDVTPAVIADIPECLRQFIEMKVTMQPHLKGIKPLRVPSKTLASRFIFQRWGIDLNELEKYRQLFTTIRMECYFLFRQLLKQEKITWELKDESYAFRIIKKYEDSDNTVLEFKRIKETSG